MAVAWFSFVLSFPETAFNSTGAAFNIMPETDLAGVVAFGVAGLLDGIFYWLVAGRITGCPQHSAERRLIARRMAEFAIKGGGGTKKRTIVHLDVGCRLNTDAARDTAPTFTGPLQNQGVSLIALFAFLRFSPGQ